MLNSSLLGRCRLCSESWAIAVAVATVVFATSGAEIAPAATPRARMSWHEVNTAHFRILKWQSSTIVSDDSQLGATCEEVLTRLSTYWFGRVEPLVGKCDIVLYPTDESYCRAAGINATQTAGSVLVGYDGQRAFFRIELRASRSDWVTGCLPHEMTHVLFAQHFAGRKLPAWINEGTALLADPASKQALHLHDYHHARTNGTALALENLMSLTKYPDQRDWPAFYGQSLSLLTCLVERKSPQAFVDFIDISLKQGFATGLHDVYNINRIDELQQIWARYNSQPDGKLAQARSAAKTFDSRNIKDPGQ